MLIYFGLEKLSLAHRRYRRGTPSLYSCKFIGCRWNYGFTITLFVVLDSYPCLVNNKISERENNDYLNHVGVCQCALHTFYIYLLIATLCIVV